MAGREGMSLGPYRLSRLLGAGGAGEVYLADGTEAGGAASQVAVKVLRGPAAHPATRAVAQQAHAISALHLAHVLPVHMVGEAAEALFIAMDYAPAGSLAAAVGGVDALHLPLSAATVARLVTQVAQALQPLHQQGIVHGDLKLTNLFVRTSPQRGPLAAMSDFGQSGAVDAAVAVLRQGAPAPSAGLAEALRCVAPEQLSGRHLPASDQYALAAIAYYLLTGSHAFAGDVSTLALAIAQAPVTPPSQLDPTVPPAAESVLLQALAKDPSARFPEIATFAQALGDALASGVASGNATLQFRYLSGERAAVAGVRRADAPALRTTRGPGASYAGRAATGIRPTGTPQAPGTRPPGAAHPTTLRDMFRTPRQRVMALLAGVFIVAVGVASIVGLRALASGSGTGQIPAPRIDGLDYAPTVTPDATMIARTRARSAPGLALLTSVSATTPVFSDPLKTNAEHWPIADTHFSFGTDGKLHGLNPSSDSIASLAQPVRPPLDYLVTVNMTFLKGSPSDVAGVSVRVLSGGSAGSSRYMMVIAPEGRYEAWYFDGTKWSSLANGYSNAVKQGLNVSNTLAVLCEGHQIWFFVNGQYVSNVYDFTPPYRAGSLGPVVVYSSTEVTYDTYNVYQVGP